MQYSIFAQICLTNPKKNTHTHMNQDQQLLTKIKLCYYASPKMDNSVASSKQFFPFFFLSTKNLSKLLYGHLQA